jgi:hypothetical protein
MYAMALSYLGALSVEDFFQLTPRELDDAIYYKNKIEEGRIKAVFEVLRLQTYWNVNKHKKRGERRIRKEILMTFPWDSEPKRKIQNAEQMKQVMKSIARSYNKGELKRRTSKKRKIPSKDKKK